MHTIRLLVSIWMPLHYPKGGPLQHQAPLRILQRILKKDRVCCRNLVLKPLLINGWWGVARLRRSLCPKNLLVQQKGTSFFRVPEDAHLSYTGDRWQIDCSCFKDCPRSRTRGIPYQDICAAAASWTSLWPSGARTAWAWRSSLSTSFSAVKYYGTRLCNSA